MQETVLRILCQPPGMWEECLQSSRQVRHHALMIISFLDAFVNRVTLFQSSHQLLIGLILAGLGGLCLSPGLVQARQYAVLAEPRGGEATPEVAMQQLQAGVLEQLQKRFDFSLQATFEQEQARLKSAPTPSCVDDSCAVDALEALPGAHLFWVRHRRNTVRVYWRGPDWQYQTFGVSGDGPESVTLQVLQQLPFLENYVVAVSPERLEKVTAVAVVLVQSPALKEAEAESKPETTTLKLRPMEPTRIAKANTLPRSNSDTKKRITDVLQQQSLQPVVGPKRSAVEARQPMARVRIKSEKKPLRKQIVVTETEPRAEKVSPTPVEDEPQQLLAALMPPSLSAPEKKALLPKPLNALDKLRFRVAEKRYNQAIWKQIKTRLLFFRKLHKLERTAIKARIRLSIDATGRIVERALLFPSSSRLFNQELLKAIDALELPSPQEVLVWNPPYVVNITLKP